MLLLQACLGQYRDTLIRTLSAHMCHFGSDGGAKKSAKGGGKKKKVSLRPEYESDHPGDAKAALI